MQTILEPKMWEGNKPLCKMHGEMAGPIGKQESYIYTVLGCGLRWRAVTEYERVLVSGIILAGGKAFEGNV